MGSRGETTELSQKIRLFSQDVLCMWLPQPNVTDNLQSHRLEGILGLLSAPKFEANVWVPYRTSLPHEIPWFASIGVK